MGVRAKFNCSSIEDVNDGKRIAFTPVYSGSKENEAFFNATPAGQIELTVVNKKAAKQFELGQPYYVDFTPAKEKE